LRAIIFDLDETLIHSGIDFKKMKSLTIEFLESMGVKPSLLSTHMLNLEIINIATEDLRLKGFSREEIQRVLDRVTEIMNQVELESLDKAALIEGVPQTLKALKARGLKVGIMTNGCREYAKKVLARFCLEIYVDAVAARTDVAMPKPSPKHAFYLLKLLDVSPEEAVLVGDHWLDAECAKKSGLKFILVGRPKENVEALKGYEYQVANSIVDIVNMG